MPAKQVASMTYGPCTISAFQPGWEDLSAEERGRMKARQGVPYMVYCTGLRVVDEQMQDVPQDGETMGEVVMQGECVMAGYHQEPEATEKAMEGAGSIRETWRSGTPTAISSYRVRPRISSSPGARTSPARKWKREHPGVLEVCVVGVPDNHWGEVPKAFVVERPGAQVFSEDIIQFTRDRIAHFKCPKYVEFGDLPKTATGKIQKYLLREKEWAGREKRIQGSQV